jgi:tetratricopeptide (TPR) repeat protein
MKVKLFVPCIFYLSAVLGSHHAQCQFDHQSQIINAIAPPEIKLMPSPSRVVIFQDFDVNELHVPRDKKKELVQECLDSMLVALTNTIASVLPDVRFILVRENDDSLRNPYKLLEYYQADIAFGIADFRPSVEKGEVSVEEDDEGHKDRTATYNITAGGVLRIYNKDSLVKEYHFSESRFLEHRGVVSGLLAVGPSLVNNRKAAIEISGVVAVKLANKFIPQRGDYRAILFSMKELREVTDLIFRGYYQEALPKALELTSHNKESVAARAHIYCAMAYHQQGDYATAFQHAKKAIEIKNISEGKLYYDFLKKYTEDNLVIWNKAVTAPPIKTNETP